MKPEKAFAEIMSFIFNARTSDNQHIKACVGAIGIRSDGAKIRSYNGSIRNTFSNSNNSSKSFIKSSKYHAEGRLLKKMDAGGVIFVARARKDNHHFVDSRPCELCQPYILAYKIAKVYYTISNNSYGIWFPKENVDRIITIRG